jgi:hypothetical protein
METKLASGILDIWEQEYQNDDPDHLALAKRLHAYVGEAGYDPEKLFRELQQQSLARGYPAPEPGRISYPVEHATMHMLRHRNWIRSIYGEQSKQYQDALWASVL